MSSVAGRTGAITLAESDITNLTTDLAAREQTANKGAASGYAGLGSNSLVPTTQLGTGTADSSHFLRGDQTWGTVSSGSSTLAADTDVSLTSPATGQVLTYDGTASKWKNQAPASAPVTSVAGKTGVVTLATTDLTDTSIASPVNNQVLTYNSGSSKWVNQAAPSAPVTSVAGKTGIVTLAASDVGAVPASDFTATGDLLAGTGTGTAATVGVGSDGQILTASHTSTGGVTWAAAPSAPVSSVAGRTGAITLAESDITNLTTDLAATEKTANKGAASGYAPLNSSSQVPIANLPTGTTSSTVAIGNDARITGAAQSLVPTAVKTSAYPAAANDYVPVDISGGSVTVTLPTAPADKTRIGVKIVAVSGTPGSTTLTVSRGGSSDVFNVSGGSTSLTLNAKFQSVIVQYAASSAIWYVQTTDTPLNEALGAALVGTDGTVGGPGGTQLSSSVVSDSHPFFRASQFGMVADGETGSPTDNYPLLMAAIAALPAPSTWRNGGARIDFEAGSYYFSHHPYLDRPVTLKGHGGLYYDATSFLIADGYCGCVIDLAPGHTSGSPYRVAGQIEDIGFYSLGQSSATAPQAHGLVAKGAWRARRCHFYGFLGDGINNDSNINLGSNTTDWEDEDCIAHGCGNGRYTAGGNAGAGNSRGFQAFQSKFWSLIDLTNVANTYYSPSSEFPAQGAHTAGMDRSSGGWSSGFYDRTWLVKDATSGDTSIAVPANLGLPTSGRIYLDFETIDYTGISVAAGTVALPGSGSATSTITYDLLTGCTRGANSTTAAAHHVQPFGDSVLTYIYWPQGMDIEINNSGGSGGPALVMPYTEADYSINSRWTGVIHGISGNDPFGSWHQRATLTADMGSGDTTATVKSTYGLASTGTVLCDNEQFGYAGLTATTLTGLTRGINGTTAAAHTHDQSTIQFPLTYATPQKFVDGKFLGPITVADTRDPLAPSIQVGGFKNALPTLLKFLTRTAHTAWSLTFNSSGNPANSWQLGNDTNPYAVLFDPSGYLRYGTGFLLGYSTTTRIFPTTGVPTTGTFNRGDLAIEQVPTPTGAWGYSCTTAGVNGAAVWQTLYVSKAAAVETLSNKRITARVVTVTQAAAPAINTDNTDIASITALAQAITSMTTNLTGTPVDGDTLLVRITDNGTARAITWGTSFEASTVALPTTTVISTLLLVEFIWNTVTSKWRCVGVA